MTRYLIYVILILVAVGLNIIAQKFIKQRWNLWLGYGLPVLCILIFMWKVSEPSALFGDFDKAYYPGGRLILQNPSGLYYAYQGERCRGLVNIPIIALLFTPFSFLSLYNAHLLLAILSGLAVYATYHFILKLTKVSGYERVALIGLFVANGPLYYSIRIGNTTHIILLLLLAVFFCIQAKREIWVGILLAIAALIKIPLLLLAIYFAMRGRWRIIAGFGAVLLVIVGASLLLFGVDLHLAWHHECIQPFAGKPLGAFNVQSVDGFLARLLYNSALENWQPIAVNWHFKIIRYALLSLVIGITTWICWRSKPPKTLEEENLEFSIVLCLALLISPISWTHYYLFLLLPFSLYLGNRLAIPQGWLWSSLLIASILLTSLPVIIAKTANPVLNFLYSRLLISHYFFGGVLLLGVLLAARWHSSKRSGHSEPDKQGQTLADHPPHRMA